MSMVKQSQHSMERKPHEELVCDGCDYLKMVLNVDTRKSPCCEEFVAICNKSGEEIGSGLKENESVQKPKCCLGKQEEKQKKVASRPIQREDEWLCNDCKWLRIQFELDGTWESFFSKNDVSRCSNCGKVLENLPDGSIIRPEWCPLGGPVSLNSSPESL